MNSDTQVLIAAEIQKTIQRLCLRINDRFSDSDLVAVCKGLYEIAMETRRTVQWMSKPGYPLRLAVCAVIALAALAALHSMAALDVRTDGINVADLVQMVGAALDGLVLIGAGIVFLVTLENCTKRRRVIRAVNTLCCAAHLIDMHQLTEDPDSITRTAIPTPHSPEPALSKYQLGRYLDYCHRCRQRDDCCGAGDQVRACR